jgi:hypothetical protein
VDNFGARRTRVAFPAADLLVEAKRLGGSMYTIEYERDGDASVLAMWFADKQMAIANACELLKVGYRVCKVQGPGFQMAEQALSAYRRAILARTGAAAQQQSAEV